MRRIAIATVFAAVSCHIAPCLAQDFYAGKQINMLIGSGVGGGYDAYARLVVRHMPKYVPGNPKIVAQNMPAAGSLVAMNLLANTAPRDGLTIGAVQNHIGVEPMLGVTGPASNAKYDGRKMNWLGSTAKEFPLVVMWHTSGITNFRQLMEREVIVGSSGVATSDAVYARVMNELIGTRFRLIDGYKGNPEMILATEQGEMAGRAGWFLSSLMSTQKQPLDEGKLKLIAQVALEKHPSLPNVPLVGEFLDSPEKKRLLDFSLSWLPMGRPYVAPPEVPADRIKILRTAFMDTMKDAEFLAEAGKQNLEILPMSGEEINKLIDRLYATPNEVVEKKSAISCCRKNSGCDLRKASGFLLVG